ncbi:MAG TPA: hypothetical protein VL988_03565 [Solirubrobacteraceae bacterium]|nr:hypothetical protein [Solirubrobacteraceae bacterium]
MDSIEHLMYELRQMALAEQERRLASQRVSANSAIIAASVAVPVFISRGTGWALVALLFYLLCLAGCVWVLMPHDFVFAFLSDELLVDRVHENGASLDDAYIAIGMRLQRRLRANSAKLASLSAMLTISCIMLGCEISALALDLVR